MKRITIVKVILSLLISSLIISYYLPEDGQKYISNVATLISLAATIITLIIAMILYNQLGLDQTILQKKSEVVFRLLDLLNERSFTVETAQEYHPLIWLTTISKYKNDYREYGTIKLLFNSEYIDYIQPIIELTNDVFLPTEILPKIQSLQPLAIGKQQAGIDNSEFAKVGVMMHKLRHVHVTIPPAMDKGIWGTILLQPRGTDEINLAEFIDLWDDLIITSTNWIAKYSSYQDLNIPFFREYYPKATNKSKLKRLSDWLKEDAF